MNMWGFTPDYFDYSEREFVKFLQKDLNTPKAEFFIPLCIDTLITVARPPSRYSTQIPSGSA